MSSPIDAPIPASSSMFHNANKTRIKDSSFNIITNTIHFNALHVCVVFLCVFSSLACFPLSYSMWWKSPQHGDNPTHDSLSLTVPLMTALGPLHKLVAPNAILNTGGRADEVRCHPGTREEVIGLIESFMGTQNESSPRMLWLSGPAGAGKTAIMQTIAERAKQSGLPHANFFFFRPDPTRNDANGLVATLMQQIVQIYPSIGNAIAAILSSKPFLLRMSLQEQIETLLPLPFTPTQHHLSVPPFMVLLIDGLDECDSTSDTVQEQILQALDNLLTQTGISFRIVVASRVEHQIVMAFNQFRSGVESIFLDEQYSPEKDIRLFVTEEFNRIKSTHYLAHTMDQDWPPNSDVDEIIAKSSGQFIYAATVMRFITKSRLSPVDSLQRVRGIGPSTKNPPFAHLDRFYTYILDQADDLNTVKTIVACAMVGREVPTIQACMEAQDPRYSKAVVDSYIAVLAPIAQIRYGQTRHKQTLPHGVLEFYHQSFSDFVQDKCRAGRFYVNLPAFSAVILPKIWPAVRCDRVDIQIFARLAFVRILRLTPEITAIFLNPDLSHSDHIEYGWKATEYLTKLNKYYDLHGDHVPADIETIWKSAVRYLVMKNTAFDCNDRDRLVVDWKAEIVKLDKLLADNLKLRLSG